MSAEKIIAGLKDAIAGNVARTTTYIGCGSCRGGTGWKHEWNKDGDLVPVDPPVVCPHCKGMGKVATGGAK